MANTPQPHMPVLLNYIFIQMDNIAKYPNNILYELKLDRRPSPTFFFSGFTVDLSRVAGQDNSAASSEGGPHETME
jgi:hypothetical protein